MIDSLTTLLWQHEWNKHGTCCAETELENVGKFFRQGLIWSHQFDMSKILEEAGVSPGKEYKIVDIHNVVYGKLSKIPSIHCAGTKNGASYLSEIRLCFSKSLELIDCHVTGNSEVVYKSVATDVEVLTNCNVHKDIIYTDTFPQTGTASDSKRSWLQMNLQKAIDLIRQALL